jgi:hypothetical protein
VTFEQPLLTAVSLPEEPAYEVLEMEPAPRPVALAVRPKARHVKSPLPPPARLRRRRGVSVSRWSGEEFEGELTDRVNNGVTWDEIVGPQTVVHRDDQAVAERPIRAARLRFDDAETEYDEHGGAESNGQP